MKAVNIIIGRFQPITTGHMRCIETVYKQTGCPTVICMIETKPEKVDPKHPFPSEMLVPMYEAIFEHNPAIEKIMLVRNADIVKIGTELFEQGMEIKCWVCGTDRYDAYSKMATKYAEQAHLPEDFEVLEIKRGDGDESATKLREALLADDKRKFMSMSPMISLKAHLKTDYYNALRGQIMKVCNK